MTMFVKCFLPFVKNDCMKGISIFLLLGVSLITSAKNYYVAPTGGNDNNPGTETQPWATWQKAFNTAVAGDTVYFRGGTWKPSVTSADVASVSNRIGTYDKPICFFNYENETPILDCSNSISSSYTIVGLNIYNSTYVKFRGLIIRNRKQSNSSRWVAGIALGSTNSDGNVYFENVISTGHGGAGFFLGGYDTLSLINCDSYNNCDSLDSGGGHIGGRADGYTISSQGASDAVYKYTYIYQCRAWFNSDDGFDVSTQKQLHIYNCWSFNNGRLDGDGTGIKVAGSDVNDYTQRIVRNNVIAFNSKAGFAEVNLDVNPIMSIYNNTVYKCNQGFFSAPGAWDGTGGDVRFYNNLVYDNASATYDQTQLYAQWYKYPSYTTQLNNTWIPASSQPYWIYNPLVKVTDYDFISTDSTGISTPRQANGSLPDNNCYNYFLKLATGSDLIDAGTDVGLPYFGTSPDIGYSEYFSGPIIIPGPEYVKSMIENVDPSRLEIVFSLALANIIPSVTSFIVKVNNISRSINSVAIVGTNVILTLASPVVYGDVVTLAYTKPSTNPLQTVVGGQAASLTTQNVINNVSAANPVYISSIIENATPSRLEMAYNLNLADIVPASSVFNVKVNSLFRAVSYVTIAGTKVYLTLASPVVYGDEVTVAYTKPSTNPLQTAAGGQAASISSQTVINNCTITSNQPPVITITSPTKNNAFISPATITIEAVAFDQDGSISRVEFFNGSTKIGDLTSPPYIFTWKEVPDGVYTLTAIATDNLNSKSVSSAVEVIVEKSGVAINQKPVVGITITSHGQNRKPKRHDNVVLKVEAYDPDGMIAKVDIKSGNKTIAEFAAAPYEFVWEDIDTGTYTIYAVATDNLNTSTVSSSIELIVMDERSGGVSKIMNLYPNPNNGHFNISLVQPLPSVGKNQITIVSLEGKTMYNEEMTNFEESMEVYLPNIKAGIYLVLISSGNKIITSEKLVVQ